MTQRLPQDWATLAADHGAALQQFVMKVRHLSPDSWAQPLAPGKWTPAEITGHLAESYRILRAELAGGQGMALRLPSVQRWLLRHTVLRRILKTGLFPAGARAPRETRPREVIEDASAALSALTEEANGFVQDLTTRASSGRVHLTHAYFGSMSARQSLQFVAIHNRHHARQLAGVQT
jgi:uncharacterized damage-inducible protein DinB